MDADVDHFDSSFAYFGSLFSEEFEQDEEPSDISDSKNYFSF